MNRRDTFPIVGSVYAMISVNDKKIPTHIYRKLENDVEFVKLIYGGKFHLEINKKIICSW